MKIINKYFFLYIALLISLFLPAPAFSKETAKKTLAVNNLSNISGDHGSDYLGVALAESISSRLGNLSGIILVERSQLTSLLKELKLNLTGVVSKSAALQVGQMSGASYLLLGSYEKQGDMLAVNLRLVNTATGEVALAVREQEKNRDLLEEKLFTRLAKYLQMDVKDTKSLTSINEAARKDFEEGLLSLQREQYETAFSSFCAASEKDPLNLQIHRKIEEAAKLGKLEEKFLNRYSGLAAKNPDSAIFHNYLGNAYLLLDLKDTGGKAQFEYEQSLKCDKNFAPPYNNLAIILSRCGKFKEAGEKMQKYTELKPGDPFGYVNRSLIEVASLKREGSNKLKERKSDIESLYKKALELDPLCGPAFRGLASYYSAIGLDSEALGLYQAYLKINPEDEKIKKRAAELSQKSGGVETEPQEELITRAGGDMSVLRQASPMKFYAAALSSIKENRLEDALVLCKEALALQPDNGFGLTILGKIYLALNRPDEAKAALEEAVKSASNPLAEELLSTLLKKQ
ncbi:MAG: FlgO family outer membrane protein [bacterium]